MERKLSYASCSPMYSASSFDSRHLIPVNQTREPFPLKHFVVQGVFFRRFNEPGIERKVLGIFACKDISRL